MKIAIITKDLWRGGAERVAANLINDFSLCGHDSTLITLDNANRKYALNDGVSVIEIGKLKKNTYCDRLLRYMKISKIIKENSFDIVLCLPEEIGIYTRLFYWGKKSAIYISERNDPRYFKSTLHTRMLKKIAYILSNGIIFQSKTIKQLYSKRIQKKAVVLKNPFNKIDQTVFLDRKSINHNKIVSIGRLVEQKDYLTTFDAIKIVINKYPKIQLNLFGTGSLDEELRQYAIKNNIDKNVIFRGYVNDINHQIKDSAIYIMSSKYEGMPNSLIESMSLGIVCISSDFSSGTARDLIKDKINGFLFKVGDSKQLADIIIYVLDNFDKMDAIRMNSAKTIESLYSEDITQKWFKFMKENMKKGN